MNKSSKIAGGIYLVVDPSIEQSLLCMKLTAALQAGIQAVQIWNNWSADTEKLPLIEAIGRLCKQYQTPLLINQDWELLNQSEWLDGVHFDKVPDNLLFIRQNIKRPFISGITCSNNIDTAIWADNNNLDYISFCSMFPSPSAAGCDIVMPDIVRQTRRLTQLPIFVSGGITPENLLSLRGGIPFNGVAVISGILSSSHPEQKVEQYKTALGLK